MKAVVKIQREIELDLPYYFKLTYGEAEASYYAVLTGTEAFSIHVGGIGSTSANAATQFIGNENLVKIDAAEFRTALSKKVEEFNQTKFV